MRAARLRNAVACVQGLAEDPHRAGFLAAVAPIGGDRARRDGEIVSMVGVRLRVQSVRALADAPRQLRRREALALAEDRRARGGVARRYDQRRHLVFRKGDRLDAPLAAGAAQPDQPVRRNGGRRVRDRQRRRRVDGHQNRRRLLRNEQRLRG